MPEDADGFWRYYDDDQMWRHFVHLRPASPQALRERFERWARGSPDPEETWLNWGCRLRDGGDPVGTLQATIRGNVALIGYAVFRHVQHRGYGREGVEWLLKELASRGVRVAQAEIGASNRPSIRLVDSLGFVLSSDTIEADDEVLYAKNLESPLLHPF